MEDLKPCPFCGGKANFGWFQMEANIDCPTCHIQISEYAENVKDVESAENRVRSKWNARPNNWQPIDTAPRDISILVYNEFTGPYVTTYTSGSWPCGFLGTLGKWYPEPTHWKLLPEGPKQCQ